MKKLVDDGIQVAIVTGGGNFWRGRTSETIDRTKADQIGMLATVMNCIYAVSYTHLDVYKRQGLEEGNHFQTFLGGSAGWLCSFWAKCLMLQIAGGMAVLIGIGSFALGATYLLENAALPGRFYMEMAAGLWLGSLIQYPIHLFLNLRFSQSVSMGIGVIQSVLAALLITGLGEGRCV